MNSADELLAPLTIPGALVSPLPAHGTAAAPSRPHRARAAPAPAPRLAWPRQHVAEWVALVVGLAVVAALMGWMLYKAHQGIDATERDRLRVQARVVDDNVGHQLDGINRALASVRDDFLTTPVHSVSTLLSIRLKSLSDAIPGVRSMVLLDADGTVVASSVDAMVGRDFGERDYFRATKASRSATALHVASPFKTSLGNYTVVFARAINGASGAFAGAVAAALEPEYFEVLMRSVLYAPDMWVSLGHADGKVFVTVPRDEARLERDWQRLAAAAAGLVPGDTFDTPIAVGRLDPGPGAAGAESPARITALRHLSPTALHMDQPLVVAVSRSLPAVFAPWRQQAATYAIFFLLLSGGTAIGLQRGQWRRRSFAALEASAAAERDRAAEKLAMALHGADLGLWSWDVRSDRFAFNTTARLQIGFTPAEVGADGGDWRERLHRSDGGRLFTAVEAHLSGEAPAIECEFRIRHKDGHWVWLLSRGRVVERDPSGVPLRVAGTHIDVTERKLAETRIERTTEMLRRTGELALIGGWELDMASGRVFWSEQVCRIHEVEPGTVPHVDEALEFYAPDARPLVSAAIAAAIADGTPWDLELPFVTAKGNPRWVRAQGVAVVEEGRTTRLLGAFQDITERKMTALEMVRLNEQLTRLSTTDALTEVGNRRLFDQTLKTEWLRASRRGEPIGLLMIDIDHFKQYNDHYGHPAGDACLRQVARMVSSSVRRGGELVARYGGEEFALLLPAADLEATRQVAERCMQKVADAKIEHRASATSAWLSISIGVASHVAHAETDCAVLVETADAALYRAKRCGRARVEY